MTDTRSTEGAGGEPADDAVRKYRRRRLDGHELRPESLMMSYGYDPALSEGAVKCPVFQTSTFVFESAEEGRAFFDLAYGRREREPAEEPGLIYSRINNPDLEVLEDRLTLWEDAETALAFGSGMSAIATTLLTFLRPGDTVIHSEPVYGGTDFLLHQILPQFDIRPVGFQAGDPTALEAAARDAQDLGPPGMILVETPANPTNDLVDIRHCARVASSLAGENADPADANAGPAGASRPSRPLVAVDNTFLGPLWQRPLDHGADLVLYSLTKYVGGHSDVIAGACLGSEELLGGVRGMRTILGTMPDPNTCWLLMRSLETLKLRMTCQMKNARYVAEHLADHPKVRRVHYLGFLEEDDPHREIYERQCVAPGGTFSFEVVGGQEAAYRMLNALSLVKLAVSLGGTESLAEHPATMTHSDIPEEKRARMGITPSMVRISVGVEWPSDIIADLDLALEAV